MKTEIKPQPTNNMTLNHILGLNPQFIRDLMKDLKVNNCNELHSKLKSNIDLIGQPKKKDHNMNLKIGANSVNNRELEIIFHQLQGMSTSEIASSLGLSHIYVRQTVSVIKTKFGVNTLLQLGACLGVLMGALKNHDKEGKDDK